MSKHVQYRQAARAPMPGGNGGGLGRPSTGFVLVLAVLSAAPTVGDIGACGTVAEPLGAAAFFDARLKDECARCTDCGLHTPTCVMACNPLTPRPATFPAGCRPVVHDGEVCLRAIEALGCSEVADLVGPQAIVPTECDFCPATDVETGGK